MLYISQEHVKIMRYFNRCRMNGGQTLTFHAKMGELAFETNFSFLTPLSCDLLNGHYDLKAMCHRLADKINCRRRLINTLFNSSAPKTTKTHSNTLIIKGLLLHQPNKDVSHLKDSINKELTATKRTIVKVKPANTIQHVPFYTLHQSDVSAI